jgi:hypothetical protein
LATTGTFSTIAGFGLRRDQSHTHSGGEAMKIAKTGAVSPTLQILKHG